MNSDKHYYGVSRYLSEDFLMHYGVIGMRKGIRKDRREAYAQAAKKMQGLYDQRRSGSNASSSGKSSYYWEGASAPTNSQSRMASKWAVRRLTPVKSEDDEDEEENAKSKKMKKLKNMADKLGNRK